MTEDRDQPQVYSRHLTGKKTSKHLAKFNELLSHMMTSGEDKPGAIADITVVEVSRANFAATIAASMLAEFGAQVIRVEPLKGDPARTVTPFGENVEGVGLPFLAESRNRRNITLDLDSEEGWENLRLLAGRADVVIDALKPGEMDAQGVGYRQLREINQDLVYVAISPYGHYTSKAEECRNVPDSDLTAQAESGYAALTGDPRAEEPYNYPVRAGIWTAWYTSAALAVAGTLTALLHRRRTGEGQMVDVASHDAQTVWHGFSIVWGAHFEMPRVRVGNFDWALFPYGYYKVKDGYVTVAAGYDADFRGLLRILGRWDLENDWRYVFDRITDDVNKLRELETEFNKELKKFTRKELVAKALTYSAQAARDRLRSKGFPIVVETLTPREVLEEKHWKIRQTFLEQQHPVVGRFTIAGPVPKMSETPPTVRSVNYRLGEDNQTVYEQYGLSKRPLGEELELVETS